MPAADRQRVRATEGARIACALVLPAAFCVFAGPASAPGTAPSSVPLAPEVRAQAIDELDAEYRDWIKSVRGLITWRELDYFLRLAENFRRDAFMKAFWEPRDLEPRTTVNELRERWQVLRDAPRRPSLQRLALPPAAAQRRPRRLDAARRPAGEPLLLARPGARNLILRPRRARLPAFPGDPAAADDGSALRGLPPGKRRVGGPARRPASDLRRADAVRRRVPRLHPGRDPRSHGYEKLIDGVLEPPAPSSEWLANFSSGASDLPAGAETFEVEAELGFPARNQSRTAVQVMLEVPLTEAPGEVFDDERFHNFQVIGEVVRDQKLFESFRYGFEGPTPEGAATVPIGFTRFLRPGPVSLRILVEDIYSGRFALVVREIDVPSPADLPVSASLADDEPPEPPLRLLRALGRRRPHRYGAIPGAGERRARQHRFLSRRGAGAQQTQPSLQRRARPRARPGCG